MFIIDSSACVFSSRVGCVCAIWFAWWTRKCMPPHQLLLLLLSIRCSQVVNCYFCLRCARFCCAYSQTAGWVQTTEIEYVDVVLETIDLPIDLLSMFQCLCVARRKQKKKIEERNTCDRFIVISIEISTISFHLHEVNFRQNDLDSMSGIYTIRRTQMMFHHLPDNLWIRS